MLRFGIYSQEDFHVFRMYEYDKCVKDGQIPCRWSPDSTFEYGQPLFDFYTQIPYLFGEIFRFSGFSVIDSTKIAFIASLVLSGLTMFVLGKKIWKNDVSSLVTSLVYTYAPYRAVDVWVRAALPEAFAFIFFPLITYFFIEYIEEPKLKNLILLSFSISGLILSHNLSVVLFLPFILPFALYVLWQNKAWKLIPRLLLVLLFTLGVTAFYILPVIGESKYITLGSTFGGYFDYHLHFVTTYQLLLSRFWGYGASVWGPNDNLSLSVGQAQWILPIICLVVLIVTKQVRKYSIFILFFLIGWFTLLLTHNKSVVIWDHLPFMKYIQFPWRFLGIAEFSFALSVGVLPSVLKGFWPKFLTVALITAAIMALNIPFFAEDLWYSYTDQQYFSGYNWLQQISSAPTDYWPNFGTKVPTAPATQQVAFLSGNGDAKLLNKTSKAATYQINVTSQNSLITVPIAYFPGWTGFDNNTGKKIFPDGVYGTISTNLSQGEHLFSISFENTPIRTVGNIISFVVFSFLLATLLINSRKKYV